MMKRVFLVMMVLVCSVLLAAPLFSQTKLTVWGRDIADDEPAHAYIQALVTQFKAKNPSIALDYVALGDPGLMDKTKIAMAANSGLPDIFQSWGGSVMGGYADGGRLLDLTADVKSIPGSAAAAGAMTWKGKIYGVAPFFAIAGLFVNEDIFKKLNLTVPTTVQQLAVTADKLKAAGIQPFACGAKDKWPPLALYMYLTNRYGSNIFSLAQARKAPFNGDAFVKAAQTYQDWVKKGYFGAQPLGEAYGDANQLMATGKAGMQVTGSWMCSNYSSADFTDQNIGFYAFPPMPGGQGLATDVMGMTDIGFAATSAAASKKAQVVTFMKYSMSVDAGSAEPGRISSVPGVKPPSRITGMASTVFAKATSVQFWWDQDLPPTVTTPMNDTIQTFFQTDTNVKDSLTKFEALVVANVGPVTK
jgi:ABC-type glycerol-3-phosphate transport system substrate-binding protein